ncbi:DUF6515 family protein [Niabella pedocola]|uniref:DUF6515 family protein n=1 Tax=Niabella pedocola TaxID=1752077 RepID=A0ABS8PPY0_9BACT|nr:DUF6515 family protein [Niabella pedocola]MCD2423150.1 DUF6515 family protein [Niabella pedocola]
MSKNVIKLGMFLLGASLFLAVESFAQYRRPPHRVYRSHSYYRAPRVSIGIGGVFGWPAPYYRYGYGPNVGVSVGIAFPPIGATIYALPQGARRVYYGGIPYYYRNDTYFMERDKGGYEVVAPPLGATAARLPNGARMRKIDGDTYYEYNGTYYRPDVDEDGERVYIVVGRNGTLDTEEARTQRYNDERAATDEDRNDERSSNAVQQNSDDTDTNSGVYDTRPQVGDQFDQLPKNSTRVTVGGKTQFRSPAGTYYKEVTVDGRTVYEVVSSK